MHKDALFDMTARADLNKWDYYKIREHWFLRK